MAWEARLGLKHEKSKESASETWRLNGLGSSFGFETRIEDDDATGVLKG